MLVAVVSLLLTGCGPAKSSDSNAAGAAGAGATPAAGAAAESGGGEGGMACGLITEADATAAIGSPAGPGTAGGIPSFSQCNFDQGALLISKKTQAKALYDTLYASLPAGRFTDVPGVGDGAFETGGGTSPLTTLQFYKGTTLVSILLTSSAASPVEAIVVLAKVAASHV